MTNVVVITDHKGTFITVLNPLTDLKKWALKWIEIDISGDNGLITLTFKTFTV